VLTAVTVVLAMRLVGVMLTSALLIIPAVSAFQLGKSFKSTLFFAACASLLSVWVGIFLSFFFNFPTGATIVMINLAIFISLLGFKTLQKTISQNKSQNRKSSQSSPVA
jgi:zinc transport system permease protein